MLFILAATGGRNLLAFGQRLSRLGFYLLFALAVTASVQLVGVYLVFASLVVPGLEVRIYAWQKQLALAYVIRVAGYAVALLQSTVFDLPLGALIVWCLALSAVALYAAGPAPVRKPPCRIVPPAAANRGRRVT